MPGGRGRRGSDRVKTEPLLPVADAQEAIFRRVLPLPPEPTPLTGALGRVLAEDVASDLDMPPFDKSMMDGYAVRIVDLPGGRGELTVIEEITAGQTPSRPLGPGQSARIMTGAPIPAGTEAVVQVERTQSPGDARVRIDDPGLKPGQN